MRVFGKAFEHLCKCHVQCKVNLRQLQFTDLDFGKVKKIVDQAEQRITCFADEIAIFALFIAEIGIEEKRGHANDRIHWGADFMAHIGQKVGFGFIDGLHAGGSRLCLNGGGLGLLTL